MLLGWKEIRIRTVSPPPPMEDATCCASSREDDTPMAPRCRRAMPIQKKPIPKSGQEELTEAAAELLLQAVLLLI